MLPAISADLPAYYLPPTTGTDGRQTGNDESEFGPAAHVDVAKRGAAAAQSQPAGTGLYGPDGRFVETVARRELHHGANREQNTGTDTPSVPEQTAQEAGTSDVAVDRQIPPDVSDENAHRSAEREDDRNRDLPLSGFNAVIPPAAREELHALADRVRRASERQELTPEENKVAADLMTRLGRYDEAHQALSEAEELESAVREELEEDATPVLQGQEDETR